MTEPAAIRDFDRDRDLEWAALLLDAELGGRMQARRGALVDALDGAGLVVAAGAFASGSAGSAGGSAGLITWLVDAEGAAAEIRCLVVAPEARGHGIGRALVAAAHARLHEEGVNRAWLVTTNDNAPAIRLYESLGYRLAEVRRGAVDELRRTIKPSIPLVGHDGVALHDELELARTL